VVLPVADQAHQQVGPAQAGRVGRRRGAERDVVAAAGAGVAAVEHELLGAQARQAGFLVEPRGVVHQLLPTAGGMDVDLDHAGVGRDTEFLHARIVGRRVAFQAHRQLEVGRRGFDRGQQGDEIFQQRHRRQEDAEHAVAHFGAQRGVHDFMRVVAGLGRTGGYVHLESLGFGFHRCLGQRLEYLERVALEFLFLVAGLDPGQRGQRQAQAQRRIAGNQVEVLAAQRPGAGAEARCKL
jgi:hypothetical protein